MPTTPRDYLYIKAVLGKIPLPEISAYLSAFRTGIQEEVLTTIDTLLAHTDLLLGEKEKVVTVNKTNPLRSVFEGLLKDDSTDLVYGFEPKQLEIGDGVFPQSDSTYDPDKIAAIWQEFSTALATLSQENAKTFAETSLHLLHRYTVFINNPLGNLPSVSFYDYARSRAGMAVCLYDYFQDKGAIPSVLDESKSPVVLIGADLSGIQTFIYNIVSKYAAKNLKGRSFYLQLLSDSILQSLLKELDLYQGNIVYGSGGAFFVLAPNIEKVNSQFNNISDPQSFEYRIMRLLQQTHSTILSLSIDTVAYTVRELLSGNIVQKKNDLMDKQLGRKKKQKFRFLLADNPNLFFGSAIDVGGIRERDVITSEEIDPTEVTHYLDQEEKEGIIKLNTQKQINLGTNLKNVDFWIRTNEPIIGLGEYEYNPCDIGIFHYLIPRGEFKKCTSILANSGQILQVIQFNRPTNFLEKGQEVFGKQHQFSFIFYGGNEYPGDEYEPLTFSEMAGSIDTQKKRKYDKKGRNYPINTETDFKRLGFLRMDIDDLGYIIRKGMGNTLYFSQYSTLSRSLDFFFKGYLNQIWKADSAIAAQSQIIYSGGDDLFIVGRWDLIMHFAKDIKDYFKQWICNNEAIGISGGVAIVTHKFPAMKAAAMAGKSEDMAKDHEKKIKGLKTSLLRKKSFTLLGKPLHWERRQIKVDGEVHTWNNEFHLVESLKEEFKNLLKQKAFAAFVRQVQVIYEMSVYQKEQGKNPSWKWVIAYHLARAKDRLRFKKGSREANFLYQLSNQFLERVVQDTYTNTHNQEPLHSDYDFIELLHFAARWAELEYRTKK